MNFYTQAGHIIKCAQRGRSGREGKKLESKNEINFK
jgi:hypothetical protein